MRLHRLLRQEEALADLAVDESVRDQLQNLDLASGRILTDLTCCRWSEGDDGAAPTRTAPRCSRLESAAVVAIAIQDLLALSGIHESGIGLADAPL
jgi:hypothetical protein